MKINFFEYDDEIEENEMLKELGKIFPTSTFVRDTFEDSSGNIRKLGSFSIEGEEHVKVRMAGLSGSAINELDVKNEFFEGNKVYDIEGGQKSAFVIYNSKMVNEGGKPKDFDALAISKVEGHYAVSEAKISSKGESIVSFKAPEFLIPNSEFKGKIIKNVKDKEMFIREVPDLDQGIEVNRNASYSTGSKKLWLAASQKKFGGGVAEKTMLDAKYEYEKGLSHISKDVNRNITALMTSNKAGGLTTDVDESFLNTKFTPDQIYKGFGVDLENVGNVQIKNAIEEFGFSSERNSYQFFSFKRRANEMASNGETVRELYELGFREKMGGQPEFFTVETDHNQEIKSLIAHRGDKTFDVLGLRGEASKLKEVVNNQEQSLFSMIPFEYKDKLNTEMKELGLKKLSYDDAKKEAKGLLQKIKIQMLESSGVDWKSEDGVKIAINMFGNSGKAGKYDIDSHLGTMTSMILSGKSVSLTNDILKQSNVGKNLVSNTASKLLEELGYMDKIGQRAAQSIDKEGELEITDLNGNQFNFGQFIHSVGEDQTSAKFMKYKDTMNEKIIKDASEFGVEISSSFKKRKDYTFYADSDFAFQDSNVMTTRSAYSMTSQTNVKLQADFSSMQLTEEFLGEELFKEYQKRINENFSFDKNQINVEGSLENKLVSGILGEENFSIYKKKSAFLNNIMGLSEEFGEEVFDVNTEIGLKNQILREERIIKVVNDNFNNNSIVVGGDAKTNLFRGSMIKDKFGGMITNASNVLIDDIEFNETGLLFNTKSIRYAGEGSKVMFDGTKSTVQKLVHQMGYKNKDGDLIRFGAMINEKMTANKRGFGGQLISRTLGTAAFHSAAYSKSGNPEEGLNEWLGTLKNEKIEFNVGGGQTKETNVLDLLGIDYSFKDGEVVFKNKNFDNASTGLNGETLNIFDSESKNYNKLMTNVAENVKKYTGAYSESDQHILGNLVLGTIEKAYDKYLSNFEGIKKAEQTIFVNDQVGIYTSNNSGVMEHNHNVKKGIRLLSHHNKMKETVARKSEDGFKWGRLGNVVTGEQFDFETVDIINKKIAHEGSGVLEEILAMAGVEKEYAPGGQVYEEMFRTNGKEVDLSKTKGYLRSADVNVKNFKERSGLFNAGAVFENEFGELEVNSKGIIKNFDHNLNEKLSSFLNDFDGSIETIDKANDRKFARSLVEKKYIFNKDSLDVREKLINEVTEKIKNTDDFGIVYDQKDGGVETHMKNLTKGFENELSSELRELEKKYNLVRKEGFSFEKDLDIDIKNASETKRVLFGLTLNKFSKDEQNVVGLSDYLRKSSEGITIRESHLAEVKRLIGNNKDNPLMLLSSLNTFSGEGFFNFLNLERISKSGEMPFLLKNIDADAQGMLIKDKGLSSLERIISLNQEMKDIKTSYSVISTEEDHLAIKRGVYKKLKELKNNGMISDNDGSLIKNYMGSFMRKESGQIGYTDARAIAHNSDSNFAYGVVKRLGEDVWGKFYDKDKKDISLNRYKKGTTGERNLDVSIAFDREMVKGFKRNLKEVLGSSENGYENSKSHVFEISKGNEKVSFNKNNLKKIKNITTSDEILSYINTMEETLKDMSGDKKMTTQYSSIQNDLALVKKAFSNSMEEGLRLTESEKYNNTIMDFYSGGSVESLVDSIIETQKTTGKKISEGEYVLDMYSAEIGILKGRKEKIISSNIGLDEQYSKITGKMIKVINQYQNDYGASLFKSSGKLYKSATATFKNSASFSSQESTAIINDITNSVKKLKGGKELDFSDQGFKDFYKAFNHLYGEETYEEVKELIYSKNVEELNKRLRKYSGLAFGTKQQMEKMGIEYDKGLNYFYGKLGRNPHQYVSSIQSARISVIDEKMENLSFFKSYFGHGQSKPWGSQNSLNFVGKLTAMSMHGDHDGDTYQLLSFLGKDFSFAGKNADQVAEKMRDLSKLQYHMRNIDFNQNVAQTIERGVKIEKGHARAMLDVTKKLHSTKDGAEEISDSDAFKLIEKQYFVQKNEMIRANLELIDEENKHSIIPQFKKLFTTMVNEKGEVVKVEVDKLEASKAVAKMDPQTRMALFLNEGNIDNDDFSKLFKTSDTETVEMIRKLRNYQKLGMDKVLTEEDINSMSTIYKDLTSSKANNIIWQNTNFVESIYGDNSGLFRTGQVHNSLTNIREAAGLIMHQNYTGGVNFVSNETTNSIIDTVSGLGNLGGKIDTYALSAKLGGKGLNPYEALNLYSRISKDSKQNKKGNKVININTKKMSDLFEYIKRNNQLEGDKTNTFGASGVKKLGFKKGTTVEELIASITDIDIKTYQKLIRESGKGKLMKDLNMMDFGNDISDIALASVYGELQSLNGSDFMTGFKKAVNNKNSNIFSRGIMLKLQKEAGEEGSNIGDGRQIYRTLNDMRKVLQEKGQNFLKKMIYSGVDFGPQKQEVQLLMDKMGVVNPKATENVPNLNFEEIKNLTVEGVQAEAEKITVNGIKEVSTTGEKAKKVEDAKTEKVFYKEMKNKNLTLDFSATNEPPEIETVPDVTESPVSESVSAKEIQRKFKEMEKEYNKNIEDIKSKAVEETQTRTVEKIEIEQEIQSKKLEKAKKAKTKKASAKKANNNNLSLDFSAINEPSEIETIKPITEVPVVENPIAKFVTSKEVEDKSEGVNEIIPKKAEVTKPKVVDEVQTQNVEKMEIEQHAQAKVEEIEKTKQVELEKIKAKVAGVEKKSRKTVENYEEPDEGFVISPSKRMEQFDQNDFPDFGFVDPDDGFSDVVEEGSYGPTTKTESLDQINPGGSAKASESVNEENVKIKSYINRIKELEDENSKIATEKLDIAKTVNKQKEEIEVLTKRMGNVGGGTQKTNFSKKALDVTSTLFEENVSEGLKKTKNLISSNKKVFFTASVVTILGTALSIFQKGRSVVKLDINEEQQAEPGKNIYREISGGYDTNMNRRRFY